MFTHETYLSPLTWRYGSPAMRKIWSEVEKRRQLRRFWVALAEAQAEAGLVNADQVADLVLFLASDDAGYITGHSLVVDGGWRAK